MINKLPKPVRSESGINWHWNYYETKKEANKVVKEIPHAYHEPGHNEDGLHCVAVRNDR